VHFELAVTKLAAAKAFYSDVFAWTFEDSGYPGYAYVAAGQGGIKGGLREEPSQHVAGFQGTTIYMQVDTIKATIATATQRGSTTIVPATVLSPQIGSFALITDPDKNVIGLFSTETHQ
jgi:predicted enzyme related to lactoylglutathione lyase